MTSNLRTFASSRKAQEFRLLLRHPRVVALLSGCQEGLSGMQVGAGSYLPCTLQVSAVTAGSQSGRRQLSLWR